jgi:hypothetical protein
MNSKSLAIAAVVVTAAAAPQLARTATAPAADPPAKVEFFNKQNPDQWRVSKLPGVHVYGSDSKDIATIDDVLMGHDGKAQYIVLAAGGVLGIGKKLVAVPFTAVTFSDEPIKPPATAPAAGTATTGTMGGGAGAPAGGATPPAQANAAPAKPVSYPDHGNIDMSNDQFKNAPDFKYVD